MKKFFAIFIIFSMLINSSVSFAGTKSEDEVVKFKAQMCCDYDPEKSISDYIEFRTLSDVHFKDFDIPLGSLVKVRINTTGKERRFHKSGFVTFYFIEYGENGQEISIEDRNICGVARKYEKINGKDATFTGAELAVSTTAGLLIPGIDILYYFTKGAIQNTKADTRFKSGVHNAYDNSIMWFFLKGKPIKLVQNEFVAVLMCEGDYMQIKEKSVKVTKKAKKAKKEKPKNKIYILMN